MLGEREDIGRVLIGRQHAELVLIEPERAIDPADLPADYRGNGGQHAVPGVLPVSVVDTPEAVDVDHQHRERLPGSAMLRQLDPKPLVELGGARKAGELVHAGAARALAHQALADLRLDVAEDLGQAFDRTGKGSELALGYLAPQGLDEKRLEGGEVARNPKGRLARAQAAEAADPLDSVRGQFELARGDRAADATQDVVDERGPLARDPLDRHVLHLGERSSLEDVKKPGLRKLLLSPRGAGDPDIAIPGHRPKPKPSGSRFHPEGAFPGHLGRPALHSRARQLVAAQVVEDNTYQGGTPGDTGRESSVPPREPAGGGDAIIGAALEGLRRAAHEVEVERSVTATLQHSLLRERLPDIPGMSFAARYLPGSAEADIGGDWYDVMPLRDGKAGLAIGDVVGRGIGAAARMAHLQSGVRAYALEGLRPSVVLERTDAFAQELEHAGMATLLYAVLDAEAGTLRYASAGHPPPLLLGPNGDVVFANGRSGSPLGTVTFPSYEESVVPLDQGSSVLLYTDGLVERPAVPLNDGLAALAEAATGLETADPDELCRTLPSRVLEGRSADDMALLAIRLEPVSEHVQVSLAAEVRSLATLRRVLGRWLKRVGAQETEIYETLVAVGEACANAIAHAYPAGEATFEVEAARDGQVVEITVRDHGRWRAARGEERRRGLTLMEQLMDRVEIDKSESGTTVVLRRSLQSGG